MTRPTLIALIALVALAGCKKKKDDAPKEAPSDAPATAATTPADSGPAPATLERATALAKEHVIVDGHIDLPWRLSKHRAGDGTLTEDPGVATEGDFDHPSAIAGGLDAPFMSIYIPARYQTEGGAKKMADQLIDMVEGLVKEHPKKFALATTPDEIIANKNEGLVSLPLGIENGAAIEGDVKNLAHFHDRGVRYITLTHSKDNKICDSSYADTQTHGGLSKLGEKVVAEMNRLGIMVDISHVSDQAFYDVIKVTEVPVIASHSSAREFTPDFERNMSDDMIKKLADNGGVIMINFGSTFLTEKALAHRNARKKAIAAFKKERGVDEGPELDAFVAKYESENPLPYADVSDVADHIEHVIDLVGVDHVGLGSDFDGVGDSLPTGLKEPADIPNLIKVLLERGHSEADIAKILGGNVIRVWRAVSEHAGAQK